MCGRRKRYENTKRRGWELVASRDSWPLVPNPQSPVPTVVLFVYCMLFVVCSRSPSE